MSEKEWTFRQEVADKLGVVFHGCNSTPLERDIHRQQCENFLVELHEAALAEAQRGRDMANAVIAMTVARLGVITYLTHRNH